MLFLLINTLYAGQCPTGNTITIQDGTGSIANFQYQNCNQVYFVTMPDTVTSIGNYAFDGCTQCYQVKFSKNLKSIGNDAFRNTAVYDIVIPDGVTELAEELFWGCKYLKKITFPKNLKAIWQGCFAKTIIEEFVFPYGLETLGSGISYNNAKCKRIVIPDSCKSLDFSAFSSMYGLQEIVLPKGINRLNGSLFAHCGFKNFTIPDTVESIGETCFWGTIIRTIVIPPKVIQIDRSTFLECIYLKSIVFEGNNLKKIAETAFGECTSLTSLTFPSSLVNISVDVCEGCTNLKTVRVQCDLNAFVYI